MKKLMIATAVLATVTVTDANAQVIGGPPAGCPHTAFCGCALALKVFGHHVRGLWPASAWFKFRHVGAAPGMVGARRHHVVELLSHVRGTKWLVYDPNSGGHKVRIHVRDIAGFSIRDPRST